MNLSRREFVAAACAFCAGCHSSEPAPTPAPVPSPPADPVIEIPAGLHAPGNSARATLPGGDDVLIWKTPNGYGAASPWCTHKGGELFFDPELSLLQCPSHGSRFYVDGAVARGPATEKLKGWKVVPVGGKIKLVLRK